MDQWQPKPHQQQNIIRIKTMNPNILNIEGSKKEVYIHEILECIDICLT